MPTEALGLKRTPLYNRHVGLGAKMIPFSGWSMPVQYRGIIEEHIHTRTMVSIFDICHMGEFVVKGPSAENEVNKLVTCRIDDMPVGKCRYGFMLNEKGGIIDDLIVFKTGRDEFMLVVNAGTTSKDRTWILKNLVSSEIFSDRSNEIAKLDVQGPLSGDVIRDITGKDILNGLKRYYFTDVKISGADVLISRTGYTGENGVELFFYKKYAETLWEKFLADERVKPAGLGARDTLRMEMGYSLYGNDIDERRTPVEANLSRFVFMGKDFIGKEAVTLAKNNGTQYILKGFMCEGRRSARSHFDVTSGGVKIGEVTSGTFSPCLKKGVGLCYIDKNFSNAAEKVVLTDGDVAVGAVITDIPIYKPF